MNKIIKKLGKTTSMNGFKRGFSSQVNFLNTEKIVVRRTNYAKKSYTVSDSFGKAAIHVKNNMDFLLKERA